MKEKLNNEIFIKRAKEKHGEKYDYSLLEYNSIFEKVKIICSEHGEFEQTPKHHLNGKGCAKCAGNVQYTTELYIEKVSKLYNNEYVYSKTVYTKALENIIVICPIHGEFNIKAADHIRGRGCQYCKRKINIENVRKITKKTYVFEDRAREIHGDKYNYSLVIYKNPKTNIKIICPEHGEFEQTPSNHIQGYGCPNCGGSKKYNTKIFIEKAKLLHNNKYDYSLVNYINIKSKVKIICPEHGIFEQTPNQHLSKHGCPVCDESYGELYISNYLKNNNIKFIREKTFNYCKNKNILPFDFYLPDYNICIEYDGIQHFKSIKHWGGDESLHYIQNNDNIKTNYCLDNNIKLIRIKYNENINEILNKKIVVH